MKAAILEQLNAPLALADIHPGELSFGQVLVKVLASGICGAQLQEIRGFKDNAKFLPHLLGHEGCGIVLEIGPGITRVKEGDKVVMHWRKGEGIESDFPKYEAKHLFKFSLTRNVRVTAGKVTTFQEQSVVSENRLTKVPLHTPVELCALLGCGLSTALATIESEMKFGQSLLIIGLGGLGVNLLRAAHLLGANPIVCADIHEGKRDIARGFGAEFIHAAFFSDVAKLSLKFDVIIDTAGDAISMKQALPCLCGGGHYIMLGHPAPGVSVEMLHARHMFDGEGKTIKATQGGGFNPTADIPRYISLHESGRLNLDGIITHRIPLDRINDGIELVKQGQASRVLIEMS
jgi:Zn-dependent alcohol dehydrogenase